MINILDLQYEELVNLVVELGQPKFRGEQIFAWIYKGVTSFDDMQNIPKELRFELSQVAEIKYPKLLKHDISKLDGTEKFLFQLYDGNCIESVFMKYKYGNAICVSSQVGCRMGCKFCASTIGGLKRNLSPGEIMGQFLAAEKSTGETINHIVVMGTGEPFDNYENLSKFIKTINHKKGLNLGMRNITVSTCGIVPKILDFARDFNQVNLAISLHSVDDKVRSSMMPINNKYNVDELIGPCKRYVEITNRRITFEYTLVAGVNDSDKDAEALALKLHGLNCHINLIPLNQVDEIGLKTTSQKRAREFMSILENRKVQVTIRRQMGDDINGACGQLRLNNSKEN